MARKVKVAVSLSPEVLELLEKHANGRSRSRCVEEELLRALRAREWERLSAATLAEDQSEQLQWAEAAFEAADRELAADEGQPRRTPRRRKSRR